jgi:three-Cys-motif partner protein
MWTEHKARFIERYLYYFVLVTKHGTYIDGFAGPQQPDDAEMWTAKRVLESEPRWLRHFYLFDRSSAQVAHLQALRQAQRPPDRTKKEARRTIHVEQGDFNSLVGELLRSVPFSQREAVFCLLDQRTFECHWATLEVLARYKTTGYKIELLYFLPVAWLGRALANQQALPVIRQWWGRDDWERLRQMGQWERKELVVQRFKEELGYWSVKGWPIYATPQGGRTMYYLIHATDHPEAPSLMARAYTHTTLPKETPEQLQLEFGLIGRRGRGA